MEKSESLLKDYQDTKKEVSVSFPRQTSQQISKETSRFTTVQISPAATWSNCIGKTQNMLRGSGSGQETAGWFHFHKVATSGHEIYAPPMDMQQVYYQSGVPEMRNGSYAAVEPRSSYSQPAPSTGYTELRPPSQVVNQRFIQCVNHFTPGSRSLPCLLQPSYYGYDYGGPIQSGSDTLLTRVEPCDIPRAQRYTQHYDLHIRPNKEQACFRQQWDNEQACQSFFPRFQEGQARKAKTIDTQEQSKNKENASSFSYLASEVSREMQWIIATGGNNLSDLQDFCKLVHSYLFSSTVPISHRSQMIREIMLSFIHLSSAYVHLGSVLLLAEQNSISQKEIENLRISFSLWESTTTSVVVILRALLHYLSGVKTSDLKKMQESDDQIFARQDPLYNSIADPPFLNCNYGDGFRYPSSSRSQYRSDFDMNQQYEFKRKYQQNITSNSQKDNCVSDSTLNPQKNGCMNFKAKSCNQIKVQNLNVNGSCSKLSSKKRDQLCNSPDSSDSDKSKLNDSSELKHFCFNLLNHEKKKGKENSQSDTERRDKPANNRNKIENYERPCSKSSSKTSKESCKGKNYEYSRHSFSHSSLHTDTPILVPLSKDNTAINRFPIVAQPKIQDWSFGVLNTGDKRSCHLTSKCESAKGFDQTNNLIKSGWLDSSTSLGNNEPEKPMSSDGEGIPTGRFSNPELNKSLEEHCESARIQLKHKMLDILGFLQTSDVRFESSNDKITEVKKKLQENLNNISYLVYTDRYRGVPEMMNAVKHLIHTTRIQNINNANAVRLVDELESSFLDLFKKEFGCCSILYPQSIGN